MIEPKKIQIELKLFVTLTQYLPGNSTSFQVKEGTTPETLIKKLAIPREQVKLIFVNGKKADPDQCLENRDRVGLFPPVGGG